MPRDSEQPAGRPDGNEVPGFVPDEWIARYGADAGPDAGRALPCRSAYEAARDDTRLVVAALTLCGGVFVAALIGWALSLAGLPWLAAAVVLAAVAGGGFMMVRIVVKRETPDELRAARQGPLGKRGGLRHIYRRRRPV